MKKMMFLVLASCMLFVVSEGWVWGATILTGDINQDGEVNLVDMNIFSEQWLETGPGWSSDLDGNLQVDGKDYAIIANHWHEILAQDDFTSSSSLDNWTIIDDGGNSCPSDWHIVSQELVESSNIYSTNVSNTYYRQGTYMYWNDPKAFHWDNYQFDVTLRSTDNDGIGVLFRYHDLYNYYKFEMDVQRAFRTLYKMHEGVETTLATVSVDPAFPINVDMQLSVNVHGDQINILLDGVNVFGSAITDADIPFGTVGLYDWANSVTYFDDFLTYATHFVNVVAANDSYLADKDTTYAEVSNGVLANDRSRDGALSANLITDVAHGDLVLSGDGTFTYTPDTGYIGPDSFVYEAVTSNQDTDQAEVAIRVRSDEEFSIVLLPDTQYYSESYPAVFTSQTQWIVDNEDALRISFMLHEGDITDNNIVSHWNNADTSLSILDGEVPYVLSVGNHDTGSNGSAATRDLTLFNSYFPVSRFPSVRGIQQTGHMENSYHHFTTGGIDWLVIALEFGPRVKVLDWANTVVTNHPNRRVIIVTHNYMQNDDTRVGTGEGGNPHNYALCSSATGLEACNDGEEMWTNFVKLHENISFVFSGHITGDGVGTLVSTGNNGNKVYQMLADYQRPVGGIDGGGGYLRIVTFCPVQQKVSVQTYSPYLDRYDTAPDQQFEFLNVDLTTP